jgi:hypothetical protein
MLDVIVLLDQRGDVAGRARRGNVLERLRGLRIKADARHILRKHGDERKAEALVKIGDELIARHFLERAVVAEALLERQVPVHIVRTPPGVLQALPEKPRLPNPPNLMPPRRNAFFAILPHQFAQRMHQLRLHVLQPLIVRPEIACGRCGAGILPARVFRVVRLVAFGASAGRRRGCGRHQTCRC